jgi:putative ATP-dependent endonuclease of OLD family
MGIHISKISIENLRNFRKLELDPFPARAVIVGENGVGKSNLLHALRLVLDPTLSDSARQLRGEDVWEGHSGLAAGVVVTVAVELSGYDNDDDAKAVLSDCTVGYAPYTARLTYRFAPRVEVAVVDSNGDVSLVQTERPLKPGDYEFVVFGGEVETNDVRRVRRDIALRVLPALRDAESDLQSWRRNPLRDLLERLPLDPANLKATANAIALAVQQLTKDPNVKNLELFLSQRLTAMAGGRLPVTPTLGFASSQPDELIRAVRLFVDAARSRTVTEASLGGANVLYLGLLLEALEQQRQQDMFVTTILAVEEPEAHLHVSLQRRLFRYLLRSEPSLLLTTHSPHIAAVAPLESLVLLRSDRGETVGATTAGLVVSEEVRSDLERYLDVSRAELLFASVVLLVEGLAESYIVPALAEAAGFDLDAHGVVVASVHGTDFAPFLRLARSLGVPAVVITDGDADADASGRPEAGLRRIVRLMKPGGRRDQLMEQVAEMSAQGAVARTTERAEIVEEFCAKGIFVGEQTLEVDLAKLFPDEMIDAFEELRSSSKARKDVEAGVRNEAGVEPDRDVRRQMLERIAALGKGRYAQRLADHLSAVDLRGRFSQHVDLDPEEEVAGDDLGEIGAAAYLFRALDFVSRRVRQQPLLGPLPSDSGD